MVWYSIGLSEIKLIRSAGLIESIPDLVLSIFDEVDRLLPRFGRLLDYLEAAM